MLEPLGAPRSLGRWPGSAGARPIAATARGVRAAGWDLLGVCVAVYVATAVGRINALFPVLLALKPTLVAAVLAIGLYVLQQSGLRRIGLLRSPTTACLLGLLLWTALSVPGALHPGLAFYTLVDDFAKTFAMCLVLAGSVRSVRDVERLILVYFGVTVVYAAVVLTQFQPGAADWRLSHLETYDANDFATLIAIAMPLGLYFVLAQRRLWLRLLAVGGLAVLAVGEVRSGSRGGFLALLAVAAFVLLRFTSVPTRSRLAGLVVIVAVALGTASERYWTQMRTIVNPHEDYNATAEFGRLKIWTRGLGYMADHPVLGVGVANFSVAEGTLSARAKRLEHGFGVPWLAAHNSFIQIGAELGVPGLLLFVALIASAFASLRRVARRSLNAGPPARVISRLALTLMAALVGFVVGAFFLSLAYSEMFYTLVALVVALEKVARAEDAQGQQLPHAAGI
jgi:O-antigen ligase